MAISQKLHTKLVQKLGQQLVMTPQLRQAIKILQVSRAELEQLVEQELAENPVLEEDLEPNLELEEPKPRTEPQPFPCALCGTDIDPLNDVHAIHGRLGPMCEWCIEDELGSANDDLGSACR